MRNRLLTLVILLALFAQAVPLRALADEISSEPAAVETVVAAKTAAEVPAPVVEPALPTVAAEAVATEPAAPPVVPVADPTPAVEPAVASEPAVGTTTTEVSTNSDPDATIAIDEEDPELGPPVEEAAKDFTNIVAQSTEYTCGPAALATLILQKGGAVADEIAIAELSGTTEADGTTLLGLKKAAASLGYDVKIKRWGMSALRSASLPVLVNDRAPDGSAHYSVVVAFTDSTVRLADTKLGNIEFDLSDFAKTYAGTVLTISPKRAVQDGMSIDAVATILDANPGGAIAFDHDGNVIPADQLDDVYDDEAATVTGKGGVASYAIPVGQLGRVLGMALGAVGITSVTAVVAANGEIIALVGIAAVGGYLGARLVNALFDAIDHLVAKMVRQQLSVKTGGMPSGSTGGSGSGSSQAPKLPPENTKIITGAGLGGTTVHAAEQLAAHPERLEAYKKIGEVMSRGKLYYDVATGAFVRVYDRFLVFYNGDKTLITAYKAATSYIEGKIQKGTWIIK